MTTPIQPGTQPAAQPATTQPASTTKVNPEWQAFEELFSQPVVRASGSTPSSSPQPAPAAAPAAPAATETTQPSTPSEGSLWETSVTGTGPYGGTWNYNPLQFATAQTAEQMAQIVGGQEQDFTLGLYTTSSPIREIVGAGDNPLNAGLVADLFQKYGEQQGSYAWTVIDRDLGITQNT